jgi:hypothetical protein
MCESKDDLESALSRLVLCLDPPSMHGCDAKALVSYFSRLEHLASAGKALCARRVAESGVYELDGHRHAGEWLAAETGDTLGAALSLLETAEAVAKLPELEEALRSGELSPSQLKAVAAAAVVDPDATTELIDTARTDSLENLKRRSQQLRAAKQSLEDKAQRDRRLHAARRVRTWTADDGTFHLDARLTPDKGAVLLALLKDEADKIFHSNRRAGVRERSEAYLADALVSLVSRTGDTGSYRPKALAQLRVDIEALRRGNTGPGEICEIAGVGPVSVATATELLGDSVAQLLITSATDVHAICNLGRAVPSKAYSALLDRDRCCVVPGCSATYNLENDHRVVPFGKGGPTRIDNLARICYFHHHLKTHEGYALEGEPGAWVWVHPDGRRNRGPKPPPRRPASVEKDTGDPDDGVGGAGPAPYSEPAPEQDSLFGEFDTEPDVGQSA